MTNWGWSHWGGTAGSPICPIVMHTEPWLGLAWWALGEDKNPSVGQTPDGESARRVESEILLRLGLSTHALSVSPCWAGPSQLTLIRNQPLGHLRLGLLTCRTVEKYISLVQATRSVAFCYESLNGLTRQSLRKCKSKSTVIAGHLLSTLEA